MQHKDRELMRNIKNFVESFYEEHGQSPSMNEIASAVGTAKSTVHRYITAMHDEGMLTYNGTSIRTDKIDKLRTNQSFAPLVGSIPCGLPDEREECVEDYIPLPRVLLGQGEFYILRASGKSMIDAGIEDGDLVIIRRQSTANAGDIVAALVDDNTSTLKKLCYKKDGTAYLHPENKEEHDIFPERNMSIQGVAIYVMKKIGEVKL